MNSPLVLLTRLRARAAWRKIVRTMKRPKGILLALFVLGFIGFSVFPRFMVGREGFVPLENVWFIDPAVMFGFWALITLSGRTSMVGAFSRPEVDFLFPGPFTRRQLMLYKLALSSLGPLGSALFFPLFLWQFALWWPALMLGIWLTLIFINTTALLWTLVVDWLGERFVNWRTLATFGAVAVVVFSLWQAGGLENEQTPKERFVALESSWAAQVLFAPFTALCNLMRAKTAADLAMWCAASLLANAVAVVLVLQMDANFLQASLVASQKRYEFIQRAKRSGGLPTVGGRARPRLGVPQFPRLAGLGPIAWRQSLDLMRNSGRLLLVLPAAACMFAPILVMGKQVSEGMVIGMTVLLAWLISTMVPLGLRTDLQHLEVFKTLPLRAGMIVSGSILAAVIYPTMIQVGAVAVLAALTQNWTLASTVAVAFAVPLNLLLVSCDSVVVLFFPSTRQITPGDLFAGVRLMLSYLAKVLFVMLCSGIAGLYVLAVYLSVGESPIAMAVGTWVVLMLEGAATVWGAALLFERLDPSLDRTTDE